jgi:hypothetical protein
MMQIEDEKDLDEANSSFFGLLTLKQSKLMQKVLMSLLGYFGVYSLSAQLDLYVIATDEIEKI